MFANIDGINVYYETSGSGPALLFVHGLGGTGNVWHAQRQGLAKFFKVVTLDLPGSGRSDKSETNYSMDHWADQVVRLAEILGLENFTLVGHSMSTILVQKAAARHAARVHALVLCGALTELLPAGKEAFVKRAETVLKEGMLAVADTVLAGALTPATREGNAALAGLYREVLLSHDPVSYAAQCHALINGSAREDQPLIRCPALILLGDQDGVTPLTMALEIAAAVADCRIRIVPATAHLTMAERPEAFNAAVLEFLAAL